MPTALSPCHNFQVPPAAGPCLSDHCTDSMLLRLGSLASEKQLLHLTERPHLAVDIHLPVGEEVLNNVVVPLLGSQVQTRGALRILDKPQNKHSGDIPSPRFPCLHDTSEAYECQGSSQMEQRTPKAPSPPSGGEKAAAATNVSTEQMRASHKAQRCRPH